MGCLRNKGTLGDSQLAYELKLTTGALYALQNILFDAVLVVTVLFIRNYSVHMANLPLKMGDVLPINQRLFPNAIYMIIVAITIVRIQGKGNSGKRQNESLTELYSSTFPSTSRKTQR